MGECCTKGHIWSGKPKGEEATFSGQNTYVTGPESHAAILLIHDLFGWTFENTRLLADEYAAQTGARVYVPDFFGGEVLPSEILKYRKNWGQLDIAGFCSRNTKAIREAEIINFAKNLRAQYQRVGAVGFCFGGWAVFRLGSKENAGLVDCISTAHPTWLEKSEIENVNVPVQIMAPEFDTMFTPELRAFANQVIPTIGVPYDYQYFPGLEHAFATRGDKENPAECAGMERAKSAAVYWFRLWLQAP